MSIINSRSILGAAALLMLLALTSGTLFAIAPACPTSGRTTTYTFHPTATPLQTVNVTVPTSSVLCTNMTDGGCCDSIVITGMTPGWTVTGTVKEYYLFTSMTPPKAPQLFNTITVSATVDGTGKVSISNICYPPSHDWPSAEVHVDLALLVASNGAGVPGIGMDPNIPGVLGPGMGGWDPVCNTIACTPGYWKTHPASWVGVNTTDLFSTVFGKVPSFNSLLTMIQATGTGGGGEKGMVRHCSAAYVGSMWVQNQILYGNLNQGTCPFWAQGTLSPTVIVQTVKNAYNGVTSFEAAQNICASMNENSICGPNGVWTNTISGQQGSPACLLPNVGPATPSGWK